MGYRKLLKGYLAHVNSIVGSDLVDLAARTQALKPREIGELRSIAAELAREGFAGETSAPAADEPASAQSGQLEPAPHRSVPAESGN
ncbi:MAG: hypothetical protein ACFHXK_16570 [bacterium]